jgi:Methyltransferase domain
MRIRRRETRRFLLKMLPRASVGAEIGVWRGDFSARILRTVRPAKLHLVDPWAFRTGEAYRDAWYGGKLAADQGAMDEIHAGVLRRFAREIAGGVVEVHRSTSAEAARAFPAAYFDWVYVDGDHLYDAVRADLALFDPTLKAGGVLAGDDYGLPGWWEDGVTRAVDDFVADSGYEVVTLAANQFVLRKNAVSRP